MAYDKSEDRIAYANAVGQTIHYAESLLSAEESLKTLIQMKVKKTDAGYIQTVKEIATKRKLLEIAEFKVARSFERLTDSDKKTNKTPRKHKLQTKRKIKRKRKTTRR